MILTTGGRAVGATSTRSSPRSVAAARASSMGSTPSCSPLAVMTRTGLMRIWRLTRIRFSRSLVDSEPPPRKKKRTSRRPGCPTMETVGATAPSPVSRAGPGHAATANRRAQGGEPIAPACSGAKVVAETGWVNRPRRATRGAPVQLKLPLAYLNRLRRQVRFLQSLGLQ